MSTQKIYQTRPEAEFYTAERCHITELFNLAQHPEASIAQARVEVGVSTQPHRLIDTHEWYYMLDGTGEMYLDDQLVGVVQPGDVVFIPANTAQYIRNVGSTVLRFICFCVPGFKPGIYVEVEPGR